MGFVDLLTTAYIFQKSFTLCMKSLYPPQLAKISNYLFFYKVANSISLREQKLQKRPWPEEVSGGGTTTQSYKKWRVI